MHFYSADCHTLNFGQQLQLEGCGMVRPHSYNLDLMQFFTNNQAMNLEFGQHQGAWSHAN